MAKIILEHQDEILTFPVDTILELKVTEVVIEAIPTRDGGTWDKASFTFKILGIQALGDGSQNKEPYDSWITRDIWGSVGWRLTDSADNKLRIWAEAIFRQELGEGFELDSDMFLQRNVRGLTTQYETKSRDAQGLPFKRHRIETLLPWMDHPSGTPASPPQAPAQGWTPQPAAPPVQDPWATQQPVPAGQPDPWAPQPGLYGPDEPPF